MLENRLGIGGFGEVWKARHTLRKGHFSAFKFCLDPDARQWLLQHEARIVDEVMKELTDLPGIVKLIDVDFNSDTPWLQYDYVGGGDLTGLALPAKVGPRARLATDLIRVLARTVAACHRLKPPVVHRDLKPANILVANVQGKVSLKITDWGIGDIVSRVALDEAKRETIGASAPFSTPTLVRSAHTPLYASPQQQAGDPSSLADDVHSLGVLWYQLLHGDLSKPLDREYYTDELQALELCPELIAAVAASVAGRLEKRLPSAVEMLERIEALPADLLRSARKPEPPKPEPRRERKIGDTISNDLGMKFAWVPPGRSWLAGGGGKPGSREYQLPTGLWCGVYPVTQEEWEKVMGDKPSHFAGNLRYPVESVSCKDVEEYLEKLNTQLAGGELRYRLPDEWEWEYICRGGPLSSPDQSAYHFYFARSKTDLTANPTNDLPSSQANFGNSLQRPSKVGVYLPNPLGIYDLHGNVWEWTASFEGPSRVLRGGGWSSDGAYCSASNRYWYVPGARYRYLGFRLLAVPS